MYTTTTQNLIYLYSDKYSSHAMPQLAVHRITHEHSNPTLLQYFDYYITRERSRVGTGKKASTIVTYEKRMRNLCKFLKSKNALDIRPDQVKVKLIREYEYFLRTALKASNDYAMKHIQIVRTILDIAKEDERITNNPVDLFDFRYERNVRRIFLELDELEILEQRNFKSKKLTAVKDVFVFCCWTGLSYMDVRNFTQEKYLKKGPDGKTWVHYHRGKTDNDFYFPLLPPALKILLKYGYRLPVRSNQIMNDYLKEIAEIVGIDKPLTTHSARKTFGNVIHNEFGVPIETVSRMLGHESIRTTEQYYVKTSMRKVMKDMQPVRDFFFTEKRYSKDFKSAA